MAIDKNGDGIIYAGDQGTISFYEVYLDNRLVIGVEVDNADPQLTIVVTGHVNGELRKSKTRGQGQVVLDTRKTGPGEADVEVIEHVSSQSINSFVIPRLPWLIANIYVPKGEK